MLKHRVSRPIIALIVAFAISINALLLSGLIGYGNDTGRWDIPYRALASALAEQGDLPLWYPNAGNGFPQLSVMWGSWTFPPLGILLGTIYPYNHFSLAIENVLWRFVGGAGSYLFARQWVAHPIGAVAIAATYVGCGSATGRVSFAVIIGQMLAPWILAGGSLAIRASSVAGLARATGILGLVSGLMVWCAYPGVWLTAPVLGGPVLLGLAFIRAGGMRRVLVAGTAAFVIAVAIITLIVSESTSLTLIEGSILDLRSGTSLRDGLLHGVDLAGLVLANPSCLPSTSSAIRVYSGVLPVVALVSLLGRFQRRVARLAPLLIALVALALANTQNWAAWDHPVFREMPALTEVLATFDAPVPLIIVSIAVALSGMLWCQRFIISPVDTVMVAGMAWVLLVSGDNPFADFLRTNVPPFALVRYNHLYFWLVTLLMATVAWRHVERVTKDEDRGDGDADAVRSIGSRLAVIGFACLAVSSVVGLATTDAQGPGATPDGVFRMGSPHLVWQAAILAVGLLSGLLALRNARHPSAVGEARIWNTVVIAPVLLFAIACAAGYALRRAGIHPPTLPLDMLPRLVLDLGHSALIFGAVALAFTQSLTKASLHAALAAIMVFDVSLAVPRYFSDNEIIGASMPGWPWSPFVRGHGGDQFLPKGSGDRKNDFAPPFEGPVANKYVYGSFNPPPPVTRMRESWGPLYDQWVYFPSSWTPTGMSDVDVRRDSIDGTHSMANCRPRDESGGDAPRGFVTRLLATTVNVTFTADCDRLLVFTDSWAPGWSATIDGAPVPVLRVNNAIRAVMAPAGDHSLVWTYRPRFLTPLLALLALGLGTSLALIATPWWSRWIPVRLSPRINRLFGIGPVTVTTTSDERLQLEGLPIDTGDAPLPTGRRLPTWGIALAITALGVAVVTSLALYDARIDGSSDAFQRFLLRSAVAGTWAWLVVAGRVGFASPVGPALLALVLLPPLALQVSRHADPITRGAPVHTVASDFRSTTWKESWEVVGRGASPDTGAGGITLRSDGSTVRALSYALPTPSPTLWAWWQRPLGANTLAPRHELAWTATIDRSGPYFTVLKLDRLTIQAVKGGILITAPAPGGDVRGDFVADASPDGSSVVWQLATDPTTSSLSLDGKHVWSGGSAGSAKTVVLGDATPDPEHRGTLTVLSASVTQRQAIAVR